MITILAEKPDVGSKIAAALDKITLSGGKTVTFAQLKANKNVVKAQQNKDGYLRIQYMGEDCYVTWGYGHLCSLKQAEDYNPDYKFWSNIPLPYIEPEYEIMVRKTKDDTWNKKVKGQFEIVKNLFNKSDLVINATDFDREGEVIFSYIYELAGCRAKVKRACFSSQTLSGIREGFDKMKDGSDMHLIEASGRMRGIADWLVGANLSVAMTLKYPGQGVWSVGRVQTAALNLAVTRTLEIHNFKAMPYWALDAVFTTSAGNIYKAKYEQEKIMNKADAEAVFKKINGHSGVISDVQKKTVQKEVPLLYNLSALQMDANSKFGLTLKETLDIAQKLYDEGYTTYPRANERYLTEDMEPVVNNVLDSLQTITDYMPLINGRARTFDFPHYFDNSKVEGHYAIIPTDKIPTGLSVMEQNIYDLICRSVIRMLYGSAILEQTKVTTTVESENFISSGSVIIDMGWMAVGDTAKTELLPNLAVGDICSGEYELSEKKTQPPKSYTDKTFLSAMLTAEKTIDDTKLRKILSDPKTGGIGTEATRADIVERLIARDYLKRTGKTITATEKGIELIDKLPIADLKSAEMTAKWEQRLHSIADGKENPDKFLEDIQQAVTDWVKLIQDKVVEVPKSAAATSGKSSTGLTCPVCGKPIIKFAWGFGCSEWKTGCKFSAGTICKKKITETQMKQLLEKGKTSLIKGFESKEGKKFDAYLCLKAGEIKFEFPLKEKVS